MKKNKAFKTFIIIISVIIIFLFLDFIFGSLIAGWSNPK